MFMDEESILIFNKADTLLTRIGTCWDAATFIFINVT